jgi:hypothetical protein
MHLLDDIVLCTCNLATRLVKFCDPLTLSEESSFCKATLHVRTMDLHIIQHPGLRHALAQGLNHIPLKPTSIAQAIAVNMHAYDQLCNILDLKTLQFPIEASRSHLHRSCLDTIKHAMKRNISGFRFSGQFLLDIKPVQNEIEWLLQHLYCSGLDKATNNACFVCIKHIRLQALERLSGQDLAPCEENGLWKLPTSVLDQVSEEVERILPESPPPYQALPYLMATYKQHKSKYRWLTNAYCTVFSNIALLLTITSKTILESFKEWARSKVHTYKTFLNVETSLYWIIDSIIDATLNLSDTMSDIFVADISRCYETIPLHGPDNLLDAVKFISTIAFKQAALSHPRAHTSLWVRVSQQGVPATAKWSTNCPWQGNWFEIPLERLILLHTWLANNCYITLGDRVWQQKTGIPMGFSYSPIWCNMYLLSYETKFI